MAKRNRVNQRSLLSEASCLMLSESDPARIAFQTVLANYCTSAPIHVVIDEALAAAFEAKNNKKEVRRWEIVASTVLALVFDYGNECDKLIGVERVCTTWRNVSRQGGGWTRLSVDPQARLFMWRGVLGHRLKALRTLSAPCDDNRSIAFFASEFPALHTLHLQVGHLMVPMLCATDPERRTRVPEATNALAYFSHLRSLTIETHAYVGARATAVPWNLPSLLHLTSLRFFGPKNEASEVMLTLQSMPQLRNLELYDRISLEPSPNWDSSTLTSMTYLLTRPCRFHPPFALRLKHLAIGLVGGEDTGSLCCFLPRMTTLTSLVISPRISSPSVAIDLSPLTALRTLSLPEPLFRSTISSLRPFVDLHTLTLHDVRFFLQNPYYAQELRTIFDDVSPALHTVVVLRISRSLPEFKDFLDTCIGNKK